MPSGRVKHDSAGRAVWEWAVDSGRHAIESTSRLLKRLDLSGLKLTDYEPEEKKPQDDPAARGTDARDKPSVPTFGGEREADPLAHSRRSFDPYDNRAPLRRGSAPPQAPPKPRITQPARPQKKPGLLSRLLGRR